MSAASPTTPRKVLIADDNPIDLHILRSSLVAWGYEVLVATEGEAAWRVLQQDDSPRLVILDWVMPGLSGIDLCRRVRGRLEQPYIYLLMVTGKTQKEETIQALDAGADDLLRAADSALYRAKANGRNRVELAPELARAPAGRRAATRRAAAALAERADATKGVKREA